jgi:glycolate oxidase FAD binding subunit
VDQDQTQNLQERLRAAAAAATPLNLRGAGSKPFFGRAATGEPLAIGGHRGIVNYQPKELVITARAGTSLDTIEAALAEHGQGLAFEPPRLGAGATLGGTIACGLSGPARPYAGSARDFVLGTRVLTGRGEVLRFGGEVMKNVAGYDVSRLMTGALGTLGVLLDVSLKVLPLASAQRTQALELDQARAIVTMNAWAGRPLPITATCWVGGRLLVRLSGAETSVAQAASEIGGEMLVEADAFWYDQIREQGHPLFVGEAPLWRLSVPPATPVLNLAGAAPEATLVEWGGAQRWVHANLDPTKVRDAVSRLGGHATLFRGGIRTAAIFQPLPPALMRIHRNLKRAFDPQGLLNPGRLFPEF